jgi:4-hydroxy-tetrahydrodipicolinate synthase
MTINMFAGMSAFPITPADAAGRVDTAALDRLLERLKLAHVDAIGLLGSTGTYAYLTRQERQRAIAAAASCIGGAVPLIVGVGALRTDEAIALARDAQRSGANALLLAPVSYAPLTQEEAYQHYLAVSSATDLPLCIYSNPSTTHFTFSIALLERLAVLPNITAVKLPLPADGDFKTDLAQLRAALPDEFLVGYSGDWGCSEALLAGADAWYSVIGGLLPVPALKLAAASKAGDVAQAKHIDDQFQPLWTLFKEFGSLRVVYALANMLSLTSAAPPRPILPIPTQHQSRIEVALNQLNTLT